MTEPTPVGNFKELPNVDDGFLWNDRTALKYLYKFIMPRKGDKEQANVKEGLDEWLLDSDDWDNIEGFSLTNFNLINKNALNTIEASTLDKLADGRNFDSDLSWDLKQYDFLSDNRTGVIQIANWKIAIENITGEIKLLKDPSKLTEDDIKIIWNIEDEEWEKNPFKPTDKQIKESIEHKEKIVEESRAKVEQFKDAQFDGSITLKEAQEKESNKEKFYALFLSVPDLDSQAAITLADATDYEITNFEDSPETFFLMYGVHFDEYKKAVKAATARLAQLVTSSERVQQLDEDEDEEGSRSIDTDMLREAWTNEPEIQEEFQGNFKDWLVYINDLNHSEAAAYLRTLGGRAQSKLESIRDLTPQESYTGEDVSESMTTFKRKIDRRKRQTKGEGREEFLPYGSQLTMDELNNSIGDIHKLIQLKPKEGWAYRVNTQKQMSNEKYSLLFSKIKGSENVIDFKDVYVKHAGFKSKDAPQKILRDKPLTGSFTFDVLKPLDDKIINKIPYIANLQRYKHLISALGKYSRRKKKTTSESIEGKLDDWKKNGKWIRTLNGSDINTGVLPLAHELFELMDKDADEGTPGITEKEQKIINKKIKYILGDYNDSYWYDSNGEIKRTGNEWYELLTKWKSKAAGEVNFINNLKTLNGLVGRLINVVNEHINDMENIDEDDEDDEEEEYSYLSNKEGDELRAIADDLNIDIEGISGENNIRRVIADQINIKDLKNLEGTMEQTEGVEEASDSDEGGLLWDEDREFRVFDEEIDSKSLLSMFLDELGANFDSNIDDLTDLDDIRVEMKEFGGVIKGTESVFTLKSYSLSNRDLNKSTRKLLNYLDFENEFQHSDLEKLNKMGIHKTQPILDAMASSTGDAENTEEINNVLSVFRDGLIKVWDRKNEENKRVFSDKNNRDKYFTIPFLEALDFEKELMDKMYNSALNNSHNSGIDLILDDLEIIIDFIDKTFKLKGKLGWESRSQYKPTTKIVDYGAGARKEGITPSISQLDAGQQTVARIKERAGKSTGLRVTASGTIVLEEGNYVDIERMDWLHEIIDNVNNLRRILI